MTGRSNHLPNLDKLLRDDDEQDFTPQGGSNLAAIFGAPQKLESPASQKKPPSGHNNPQSPSPPSSFTNKTEVIVAKVVHAYKLKNGQYSLIGKLGIALAGNSTARNYLLILYKTKQEHISVVTLTPDFFYSIRENNYATYYDGNKDNWSILFENSEAAIEFAREIGLAKYFLRSVKFEDSVFFQDLTTIKKENEGNETKAEENDELEINYFIIPNISQPLKLINIPKQSMRIRISSDDNWEKSLVGVYKNLKLLLILPRSKQISLGPGYPREQDIAIEIEILEIIKPEPKTISSPKHSAPVGKASLISRMAKMGQSMLPKLPTSTTTDSEDTEDEVQVKSPRRVRGSQIDQTQTKSSNSNERASAVNNAVTTPQSPATMDQRSAVIPAAFTHPWNPPLQQFLSNVDGQLYSYQAPVHPQIPVDPSINIFLSESRTHNAEIRMGMSKIADNVQKLLDKFHAMELERCSTSPISDKSLETSLKVLLSLKDNMKPNESSDVSKNSPSELNLLQSRETIKSLEDTLQSTNNSLSECLNNFRKIENEKKEIENEKCDLREKIQRLESSLADSQTALQETLTDVKDANQLVNKYQKDNALLDAKITTIEANKKSLEESLSSQRKNDDKSAQVKQIMNKTYQALVGKFTEDSYTTDYIKTILANTIRSITLQVLQERKGEDTHDSDTEMKESETASKPVSSSIERPVDDTLMLPDVDVASDRAMDIASAPREEPPPIPPMDLDIDNDWLS